MSDDENNNIVFVRFGKRALSSADAPTPRAIRSEREAAPAESSTGAIRAPKTSTSAPAEQPSEARLFETTTAARVLGLTPSRLRYWARTGFIPPTELEDGKPRYSFRDLLALRTAKSLLDAGVPLPRVRESLAALTDAMPVGTRPTTTLASVRIVAEGQRVLVRDPNGDYDPVSGQQELRFRAARPADVREIHTPPPPHARRATAYALYLEGCRLDTDESTLDRAESAYLEAIRTEPTLACAYTNLGNVRFRRGAMEEASTLYRRAIALDPIQPEAHYNLGFLAFEDGDVAEACRHFREAVSLDDAFADAHFNLAMALTQQGDLAGAQPHWEAYLALDPRGPWAEIARRHVPSPS